MKARSTVCSLLVAVCVSCFSQTTEPPNFNPDDPQVISNVQEILSLLGYGHLPLGPMNKQTVKVLKEYQVGKHLAATGKIDVTTYQALLNDYEHPPTFIQIRDAGKLPRWATSVCLEERSLNKDGKMEGSLKESDPKTASGFFVYGPKGNLDIQTEEYLVGRPFAHADWQREKSERMSRP